MENIEVSVVVPLYNTRDYIRQTLESIAGQTLRAIEIVVVDDGSTDGGGEIVREMAARDPRIRLVVQQNRGPSESRNTGLSLSVGEYVYFMDSDDLLDQQALEACFTKCRENALDFVLFDAEIFGEPGCFDSGYYRRTQGLEDRVYSGEELLRELIRRRAYRASVCLNLFRREFLEERGLRFYPRILHEDELFTFLCYVQAARAGMIPQAFFKRRMRPSSIMTARFARRNIEGYFTVANRLLLFARQNPPVADLVGQYVRRMLDSAVYKAWEMPFGQRLRVAAESLKRYPKCVKARTLAALLFKKTFQSFRRK